MSSDNTTRSDNNGPMQFHLHIEDELAKYVMKNAKKGDPDSVLATVDEYCWNHHWMRHVGDKKGEIVDKALIECQPKIILELGTYCGYSAVRMARFLPEGGKLYTIDPCPTYCSEKLVEHAGLTHKIIRVRGLAGDIIPVLTDLKGKVDLVFIDHDKKAYLPDLLLIEKYDLLHPGSVVVADNVVIFKINDYLDHVRNPKLYSSSVNHLSTLEYDNSGAADRIDGIEVSIWKGT